VKLTKEYDWKFDRVNSKGEIVWRSNTYEDLEYVTDYLNKKYIKYEVKEKAQMLKIKYKKIFYAYYYTTGRWSPYVKKNFPEKHYYSKGIEDFVNRFLFSKLKFEPLEEKIEDVEKLLKYNNIKYKIEKDTVNLTTKIIPRKDGRGNRRTYSYEYILGKGKWRNINSDGTPNEKFYQARNIEHFLTKFFNDDIKVIKHETK
jgi:hypothetical protein